MANLGKGPAQDKGSSRGGRWQPVSHAGHSFTCLADIMQVPDYLRRYRYQLWINTPLRRGLGSH